MVRNIAIEKEWKERYEEYKKSGLSIKAWSAKNGLKTTTVHYWIRRLKELKQIAASDKVQFAEVLQECCKSNNTVENKKLYLSFGSYKIDIEDGFSSDTLTKLLKVLKSL